MSNPTAADLMTGLSVTLSPTTNIRAAIRSLLKHRITGAPVVDATGGLVGFLSEKDCLRAFAEENDAALSTLTVRNYMSAPTTSITPATNLYDIVGLLLKMPFRRLPVLDREGRPIGQVARADAMRAILANRDNQYLYGAPATTPTPSSLEQGMGVDSAIRLARGERTAWQTRKI